MNKKGQALVEYILIIALVSVVVIAAVKIFGGQLKDKITESSCTMLDQQYVPGDNPGEAVCK